MMSMWFGVGLLEVMMLFSGGGILGMPPGERDPQLLKTAPENALIYSEWASRGEGEEGAPGVDGFMADPEIREFASQVIDAIIKSIERESQNGSPQDQIMGKTIPPLVLKLIQHSGCMYITYDQEAATLAMENLEPGRDPMQAYIWGVQVTLIVNGGDDADKIAEHLKQLCSLLPADTIKEDLQFQQIPIPTSFPGAPGLMLHRHGNYFILGFGKNTVENAVAGLEGKHETSLADNARLTEALKKLSIERVGSLTWVDIAELKSTAAAALGPQGEMIVNGAAEILGADTIDSLVSVSGVVEGQIRTQSFLTTGGSTKGVLSLAAGRPLTPDDFAGIPADVDFLYAFSINLEKVYQAASMIIEKADPQAKEIFEDDIKQLEEEFGIKLQDLFDSLGDVWTLHNSPASGGVFVTSLIASVEVKDHEKAEQVFTQLMKILENLLPGDMEPGYRQRRGIYLEQKEFMGQTIYYMNFVGDEMPFAPAFCLTENHILAALHPQALKAHLRFLAREDRESLAAAMQDRLPEDGETITYSYFDAKTMFHYLYSFAPYIANVIFSEMQGWGVSEMDIFSLPSAQAFLQYMSASESRMTRTPDGILLEGRSGLPIPGGLNPVLFLAPALGFFIIPIGADEMAPPPVKAAPGAGKIQVPPQRDRSQ